MNRKSNSFDLKRFILFLQKNKKHIFLQIFRLKRTQLNKINSTAWKPQQLYFDFCQIAPFLAKEKSDFKFNLTEPLCKKNDYITEEESKMKLRETYAENYTKSICLYLRYSGDPNFSRDKNHSAIFFSESRLNRYNKAIQTKNNTIINYQK